jgi:site-specific recombinase XerD
MVDDRPPGDFRNLAFVFVEHYGPKIAWRDDLTRRGLSGGTIRRRLASVASLFDYLCEKNAVAHNPVKGVERPKTESVEGKTPALADHQARKLLTAPENDSLRGKRDRAILSTLLFHALRREELCKLKVKDFRHVRKGVPHLKVAGKGGKTRYLPLHPGANALIHDYLEAARHGGDDAGALFRPVRNNATGRLDQAITADGVYKLVRAYSARLGFEIGAHALRATAATNALAGRHRQGAGMAWARQHRNDTDLRPPPHASRGQPDVQGDILTAKRSRVVSFRPLQQQNL